jgi:hypothetical protein
VNTYTPPSSALSTEWKGTEKRREEYYSSCLNIPENGISQSILTLPVKTFIITLLDVTYTLYKIFRRYQGTLEK